MVTSQADNQEHVEATLRARLAEAEELLRAIRHGDVDALVVESTGGNQVYTLHSADEPYRDLVEQMQEGAVVLTGRGDILYSNARFAALVGEPLESGGQSHRQVRERVRQRGLRDAAECRQRTTSQQLDRVGFRRLRRGPVAHHSGSGW